MTGVVRPSTPPNSAEVEAAFRAVPETMVAEILDGELHTQARPAPRHAKPDWTCEVLSTATEANDRAKNLRIYRREGVGHVWLLNPTTRTLEVYRLEVGRWILLETYEGTTTVCAEPVRGLRARSLAVVGTVSQHTVGAFWGSSSRRAGVARVRAPSALPC